jgi:DNA-binding LacI/PurR family transcriptional regulator
MKSTRQFRKATIRDVAERAGVSTTTVSMFVSGREDVCSTGTAERIRAAIAALNYTPSSLVGSVQGRARMTFGICVYSPYDPNLEYGSLFFERLWRGIGAQASDHEYAMLFYPRSVHDSQRSEPFLDGRVDGVLFHVHSFGNALPERVASAGMPTVLLARSIGIPGECGAAFVDESEVVDLALSHLAGLGHRRIAHIAGPVELGPRPGTGSPWSDDVAVRRLNAYQDWMRARGDLRPEWIGYAGNWSPERVPDIIAAWADLTERPTAVFCANDMLAIGAMTAARRIGWRVPEELSIVGVDNSPAASQAEISLTSVDAPIESLGRAAVQALFDLIQGTALDACRVAVRGSELVLRSSTAAVSPALNHHTTKNDERTEAL